MSLRHRAVASELTCHEPVEWVPGERWFGPSDQFPNPGAERGGERSTFNVKRSILNEGASRFIGLVELPELCFAIDSKGACACMLGNDAM